MRRMVRTIKGILVGLIACLSIVLITERTHAGDPPFGVLAVDHAATGANDGTSWEDAYTDLQDALEYAAAHEEITSIWVGQGTYLPSVGYSTSPGPTTHWHKTFRLIDAVKIYGGFVGVESLLTERDPENNITTL